MLRLPLWLKIYREQPYGESNVLYPTGERRAGAVLGGPGFDRLPRLGARPLCQRRDGWLRLRPAARRSSSNAGNACARARSRERFPGWAITPWARPCNRHHELRRDRRNGPDLRGRDRDAWTRACPRPSCPGGTSSSSSMPRRSATGVACIPSSVACARPTIRAIPIAAMRRLVRSARRSGSAPRCPSPSRRR